MNEYSQGICEDGAAILKNGQMMTIEEIVSELQERDQLKELLSNIEEVIEGDPNNIHAFSERSLAKHDAEVIERFRSDFIAALTLGDGIGFKELTQVEFSGFCEDYIKQFHRGIK